VPERGIDPEFDPVNEIDTVIDPLLELERVIDDDPVPLGESARVPEAVNEMEPVPEPDVEIDAETEVLTETETDELAEIARDTETELEREEEIDGLTDSETVFAYPQVAKLKHLIALQVVPEATPTACPRIFTRVLFTPASPLKL